MALSIAFALSVLLPRSTYHSPASVTARTLRVDVVASSDGNTGAAEVAVHAPH